MVYVNDEEMRVYNAGGEDINVTKRPDFKENGED